VESVEFRRLHPLTPLLRGWKVFAAALAIAAQQLYGDVAPKWLLAGIVATIPAALAYGYVSWRFTRYVIAEGDLRLETGVLFRRSRRVRLDRLQAVDVVRPLVARLLGLAELRLEVAGGTSSEAPLAYLSEPAAQQLRAELLARAAGLSASTPEAPETVLTRVPLQRLVAAALLSVGLFVGVALFIGLIIAAVYLREWSLLGVAVPIIATVVPAAIRGIIVHFDFTVAESPDGLRLRHGLLETRAQTVPPGRVQAVRVAEPWLWRLRGWVRLQVNVAGYVGQGQQNTPVLLPVAPRPEALGVLGRVLPGVDIASMQVVRAPARARWLDPLGWRFLVVGGDEAVFVTARGRFQRETDIVPHERVQSVRLSQGPLQRRLGLATLALDTTPGPVRVVAAHRDAAEGRRLLDAEVDAARTARAQARPERWMHPAAEEPSAYRGPVPEPVPTSYERTELLLELSHPPFIANPYPVFAELRERSALSWHEETNQWLALAYAECNTVLRDRRLGRLWSDRQPGDRFEPFNLLHSNQMMENEPPTHTRLRSLVAKAFARGHIERLRPRVQEIADGLLDRVGDEFDLLADYAEPLPVAVIAELLGVPPADHHLLRPWSAAIVKMYEYERSAAVEDAAIAASAAFADYMHDLAAQRRADPRDDLVSHLVAAEESGERLSGDELVASAILLLNAGHEASVNAFGNGFVALLRHPEELARVRTDDSLVGSTVEEMIRYDSPLQLFERTVREEIEIGGVHFSPGMKVSALLGAANRDPAEFPDPDRFDAGRRPNRHIGFGAGVHHCLGAPLARMELQISLPTLLRRFPRIELAEEPQRRNTFVLRGYQTVRVHVGSAVRAP
jgi:cytochrome P450/uncharacterized membrane protein YdbT with pleckstrin-like domain